MPTFDLKAVITAEDRASGVIRGFGASIDSSMKKAATGSKMLLAGLVGLGVAAGKMTLTAARTETLGVAMNAVAKATGTSTEVLAEQEKILKKQGITTQEARSTLTKFMQSQLDVADASKIARVAQDLAVISGENSSIMTGRLTDAIATMNPMLLREAGIVKNLDDVFKPYAETLGKSADELTDVEKKQAMVNMILQEGEKVAGTYEDAMGTAGKKLGSLPRFLEEAANAIGGKLLPALNWAIDGFTNFLKSIYKVNEDTGITELSDKWEGYFNKLKENLPIIAGAILFGLVPAFYSLASAIWAAMRPLLPFIVVGTLLGLIVKTLVNHFGGWSVVLDWLKPKLLELWNRLKGLAEKILPILAQVWDKILKPALSVVFNLLKEQLIPALKELWEKHGPAIKTALKVLAAIFGGILLIAITSIIISLGIIIAIVIGVIKAFNWLTKTFEKVIFWIARTAFNIQYRFAMAFLTVKDWIEKVVGWFFSLPGRIAEGLSGLWDAITAPFRSAFGWISGKLEGLKGSLSNLNPLNWFRQFGGPVSGGSPYIVGEKGPELFVPYTSGRIVPNQQITNNQGVTINFYGSITNTSNASLDDIGRRLARQLEMARYGIS